VDDADLLQEGRQQKVEPLPAIKHDRGNDWVPEEQSHHQKKSPITNTRQDCDAGVGQELAHPRSIKEEAFDRMLAYDKNIRLAIEPKPNEPMDHAYIPTIGHALAVANLTRDPKRVGCLIESAHAILAGLDPADEIDFAMAFGKLWSLHLNDQNGLKYDQDRPFGNTNLRSAFDQVRALERNGYLVVCAMSGAEGLRMLERGNFLGVVSDMRTPGGVDGADVHAWLASNRPDLASRLVFITGDIANEETVATLNRTGAPCVEKPFRVQQFISVVEQTMGKS